MSKIIIVLSILLSACLSACARSVSTSAGKVDMTQFYSYDASIDAKDKLGRTALHRAAGAGDIERVRALLDKGASLDVQASPIVPRGVNVLIYTRYDWNGTRSVARRLTRYNSQIDIDVIPGTPLHYAAAKGHHEIARLFIEHGARLDSDAGYRENFPESGWSSWTPLFWAVWRGDVELTQLLLYHGAAIDISNSSNETPLFLAAIKNNLKIVQLLLTSGNFSTGQPAPMDLIKAYCERHLVYIKEILGRRNMWPEIVMKYDLDPEIRNLLEHFASAEKFEDLDKSLQNKISTFYEWRLNPERRFVIVDSNEYQ